MGVRVENGRVVINRFEAIKNATPEQIGSALLASATGVVSKAKVKCPKRTGNLSHSIHEELDSSGLVVEIGTDVHYAAYVELGTSRMVGRPYLKPALFESRADVNRRFKAALEQAIAAGAVG